MNNNSNKLYVVGDIHSNANNERKQLNTKNWPEQKELTKDDILIQLRDFGDIWYHKEHKYYKQDRYWQEWWASRNYTLLVVPGNHENWDIIESLPIETKFNAKVRVLNTEKGPIYLAITGEIYTINNFKILTICGAKSTDALYRTEGISWWRQETITQKDIDNTLDNLETYETIDYIFSHTMPQSMIEQFIHYNENTKDKFKDPTAEFLEHLWNTIDIKYGIHCGHFHTNQKHYRKTPFRNKLGKIVFSPDIDNNYVQCHYNKEPYLIED